MKRRLGYLSHVFLCFIIIITLNSCDKIFLRLTGNYKTPREQDSISIFKYVKSHNAYYDQLYVFKSKIEYRDFFREHTELPGNLIFDSEKRLLHASTGTDCPWSAYYSLIDSSAIIQSIKFLPDSVISYTESLDYIIEKLKPLDIDRLDEPYNYYIISVWAKFTPKFTRKTFKDLYRFKNIPNKRICVILVNADIQKGW
jgi:hypothetical protein